MDYFKDVTSSDTPHAHGEVNFVRILDGTVDTVSMSEVTPDAMGFIVGHSESGHHHVLDRPGVTMKRGVDSRGFEILHAIVTEPTVLRQAAGDPHKEQIVRPGEYLITKNVETDPFTKQARQVAD